MAKSTIHKDTPAEEKQANADMERMFQADEKERAGKTLQGDPRDGPVGLPGKSERRRHDEPLMFPDRRRHEPFAAQAKPQVDYQVSPEGIRTGGFTVNKEGVVE